MELMYNKLRKNYFLKKGNFNINIFFWKIKIKKIVDWGSDLSDGNTTLQTYRKYIFEKEWVSWFFIFFSLKDYEIELVSYVF